MTVIYPTVPPQLFFRKSVVPAVVVPYQSTGHGSLPTIRPPLIFTLSPHHDRLRLAGWRKKGFGSS